MFPPLPVGNAGHEERHLVRLASIAAGEAGQKRADGECTGGRLMAGFDTVSDELFWAF